MTAQPIYIFVPGPICGKGRPRFVRATGRTYTPSKTASYEAILRYAAMQAMTGREMIFGPVSVKIDAGFDIPKSFTKKAHTEAFYGRLKPTKKPDADNILKLVDAFNGIVWKDDVQITSASITKQYSMEPGLSIEVTAI